MELLLGTSLVLFALQQADFLAAQGDHPPANGFPNPNATGTRHINPQLLTGLFVGLVPKKTGSAPPCCQSVSYVLPTGQSRHKTRELPGPPRIVLRRNTNPTSMILHRNVSLRRNELLRPTSTAA
jgi:hypothetical protein